MTRVKGTKQRRWFLRRFLLYPLFFSVIAFSLSLSPFLTPEGCTWTSFEAKCISGQGITGVASAVGGLGRVERQNKRSTDKQSRWSSGYDGSVPRLSHESMKVEKLCAACMTATMEQIAFLATDPRRIKTAAR